MVNCFGYSEVYRSGIVPYVRLGILHTSPHSCGLRQTPVILRLQGLEDQGWKAVEVSAQVRAWKGLPRGRRTEECSEHAYSSLCVWDGPHALHFYCPLLALLVWPNLGWRGYGASLLRNQRTHYDELGP